MNAQEISKFSERILFILPQIAVHTVLNTFHANDSYIISIMLCYLDTLVSYLSVHYSVTLIKINSYVKYYQQNTYLNITCTDYRGSLDFYDKNSRLRR